MPELKLNDQGAAIVEDGKVILIHEDGKEAPFDINSTVETLEQLRGEAGSWRKRLRDAEENAARFEGIEDPDAARNALQTVASMSDEHKVQVENLKNEMSTAWGAKVEAESARAAGLEAELFKLKITDKFHTSAVAKRLVFPPEDAAKIFDYFRIEDGKMVGKLNGKDVFSKERPGEPAEFDEALEAMIDARPDKANILRPTGMQGAGSPPGNSLPPQKGQATTPADQVSAGVKDRGWDKP